MGVARFGGGRTGTAPLTWAQRGMWNAIARNPPAHFAFGQVVGVPDGGSAGIDDMAETVGRLMPRHESLRTLVRLRDGEPYQMVMGSGQLRLSVVETVPASVDPAAEALKVKLCASAFDLDAEWPLRAGVVVVDGQARRIALAYSHMAADGRASRTVAQDLQALLTPGASLAGAGPQPLDLAREQQADKGRRTGPPLTSGPPSTGGSRQPPSCPSARGMSPSTSARHWPRRRCARRPPGSAPIPDTGGRPSRSSPATVSGSAPGA